MWNDVKERWKERSWIRRYLCLVLVAVLVTTQCTQSMGVNLVIAQTSCPSHEQHDEDCGYKETRTAHPCSHNCEDGTCSYQEAVSEQPCDHSCDENCVKDENGSCVHNCEDGTCSYQEAVPEQLCNHICDESCSYVEIVIEQPCSHTCSECEPEVIDETTESEGDEVIDETTEGEGDEIIDETAGSEDEDIPQDTENDESVENTQECLQHMEHDDTCGYKEGDESAVCTHSCLECDPAGDLNPTEAEFDKNIESENYKDIEITFEKGADKLISIEREIEAANEGAENEEATIREAITYILSEDGQTVTLERSTLEQFEEGGHTLYFVMESGVEKSFLLTITNSQQVEDEAFIEFLQDTADVQDVVLIDESTFPAEDFREFVRKYDTDSSGGFSEEEISKVTSINLGGNVAYPHSYTDLRGIEVFTSMTSLNVSNSISLTSLDVSGCTALETLNCYNNQMESLVVSGLPALKTLVCRTNRQLTSLIVKDLPALETLTFYNSPLLVDLELSNLPALKVLDCSMSPQLTSLDVNNFLALEELDCSSCPRLARLNVSGCTSLTTLKCYGNQLTSLDTSSCPRLTTFEGENQSIGTLSLYFNSRKGLWTYQLDSADSAIEFNSDGTTFYSDVEMKTPLPAEMGFSVDSENHLLTAVNAVPVVSPVYFKTVLADGEHALTGSFHYTASSGLSVATKMIELNDAKKLNSLDELIAKEYITFPNGVPGKYTIECIDFDAKVRNGIPGRYEVTITSGEQVCVVQLEVVVGINDTNFTDPYFEAFVSKYDTGEPDGYLTHEELAKVVAITVNGTSAGLAQYKSLKGIEYFTSLTFLQCSNGSLAGELDLSGLQELRSVACQTNDLTSLDVSGCKKLTLLYCYDNDLTSLNASGCTALNLIECYKNPDLQRLNITGCIELETLSVYDCPNLQRLDVSDCTNLKTLNCIRDTALQSLDVRGLTKLEELHCHSCTNLKSLNASGCTALKTLNCRGGTNLQSLNVDGCTALQTLSAYNCTNLQSLDVSGLRGLTTLNCSSCPNLQSLDVSGLRGLTTLNCSNCPNLQSLNVDGCTALETLGAYNCTVLQSLDVSGCTALKSLSVYSCPNLQSLDVSDFKRLQTLHCYSSGLTSLNVSGCTALTTLNCYNNQLSSLDITDCPLTTKFDASKQSVGPLPLYPNGDEVTWINKEENPNDKVSTFNSGTSFTGTNSEYFLLIDGILAANSGVPISGTINFTHTTIKGEKSYPLSGTISYSTATFTVSEGTIERNLALDLDYAEDLVSDNYIEMQVSGELTSEYTVTCNDFSDKIKAGIPGRYDVTVTYEGVSRETTIEVVVAINNEANFPAEDFREFVSKYDTDKNEILTPAELAKVTSIGLGGTVSYNHTYTDLSGIEFFTSMTSLEINNGSLLKNLDVSGCKALESLSCYYNQLESLDISGLPALKSVVCRNNLQLKSLNISNLPALETLNFRACPQLMDLNLSDLPALKELDCSMNSRLTSLDVNNFSMLEELNCSNCPQMTSLNVSGCTVLTTLKCYGNQLASLDTSSCPLATFEGENQSIGSLPLSYDSSKELWVYQPDSPDSAVKFHPDSTTFYSDAETKTPLPAEMDFSVDGESYFLTAVSVTPVVSPVYFKTVLADGKNALTGSFHYTVSSGLTVTTQMIELNDAKEKLETETDLVSEGYIRFDGEVPSEYTIECADFDQKVKGGIPGQYGVKITSGEQVCLIQIEVVVGINGTNFTDSGFAGYVSRYDTDGDENLTSEELSKVTVMVINGTPESPAPYKSLKGIEYFTSLANLQCNDGSLTGELDVTALKNLRSFACQNNGNLTSLNISGLEKLESVPCFGNELMTSVDASGCIALTTLTCQQNPVLQSLDITGCIELETLSAYDCPNLQSLDVSDCTNLKTLNCTRNTALQSLDVRGLTKLEALHCPDCTNLQSLDVSGCTALKTLNCRGGTNLQSLNVGGCTALTTLNCYSCPELQSLNVSDCIALTTLSCYSCTNLQSLNVSGLTALTILNSYNTNLQSLNVSGCTALQNLTCDRNPNLQNLNVSGCKTLTTLKCYNTNLQNLDVSGLTALETVDFRNCTVLQSLDASGCTALKTVSCSGCPVLQSIDFRGCTALTSFSCLGFSALQSLNVSGCTALISLNAGECKNLTSLDVSGCEKLEQLRTYETGLTSLDVSGLPALYLLYTRSCPNLTSVDASDCKNLKDFSYRNNPELVSLDISRCTALEKMTGYDCPKLQSLDVSYFENLHTLECYNNGLKNLNVSGCTALTTLTCYNNQLSSLDIADCPLTTKFDASNQAVGPLPLYPHEDAVTWINKAVNPKDEVRTFNSYTSFTGTDSSYFGLSDGILIANSGVPASGTIDFSHTTVKDENSYILSGTVSYSASALTVSEGSIERNEALALTDDDGLVTYFDLSADDYEATCADFDDKVNKGVPGRYDVTITSKDGTLSRATTIEVNVAIDHQNNFQDPYFQNYVSKFFDTEEPDQKVLTFEELQAVQDIDLSKGDDAPASYSSLKGIEFFTNLESLDCSNGNITNLDVSNNGLLQTLKCDNSGLSTLDLGANTNLLTLKCSFNNLVSLEVSGCTNLQTLECMKNNLGSLVVNTNKKLTSLHCSYNELTELNVGSYLALTELSCDENNLKELDISRLKELQTLSCNNNQLTYLNVEMLENLTTVHASDQEVLDELQMYHDGTEWSNAAQETDQLIRSFIPEGATKFYEYLVDEQEIGNALNNFAVNSVGTLTAETVLPKVEKVYFTSTLNVDYGYTQVGTLDGTFVYVPNYELEAANSPFYTSGEIIWQALKEDADLKNLEGLLSIDPGIEEVRNEVITSMTEDFEELSKGITGTYNYKAELTDSTGTKKTLESSLHVVPKGAVISEDRTEYIYAENFVIGLSTVDSFSETLVREKALPVYGNNLNTDVGGSFSISEEDIITIQNITSIADQDTYPVTLTYSYTEEEVLKEMSIEVQVKIMDDSPEDLIFVPVNIVMTRDIGAEQAVGEGKLKLVSSDAEQVLTRTVDVFTDKRFYLTSVLNPTIKLAVDVYNADNSVYNGSDPLVTLDFEHTEGTFKLLSREVNKLKDSRHTGTMQFTIKYGEESDD